MGELFGISAKLRALQPRRDELAPLYSVKRLFVQRRAVKGVTAANAEALDGPSLPASSTDSWGWRPTQIRLPAGSSATPSMSRAGLPTEAGNNKAPATAQLYAA